MSDVLGAKTALKRIVLHLARSKEHPEGSARHGYDLVAPLDASGRLDAHAWREARARCRVRRFWDGEPGETGHLVHRPGGPGGATWAFDYDPARSADDEAGYRFGDHSFNPGDYVSIRGEDGVLHTFKVATVADASNAKGGPTGRPFSSSEEPVSAAAGAGPAKRSPVHRPDRR